jgi:hypothetical protein
MSYCFDRKIYKYECQSGSEKTANTHSIYRLAIKIILIDSCYLILYLVATNN